MQAKQVVLELAESVAESRRKLRKTSQTITDLTNECREHRKEREELLAEIETIRGAMKRARYTLTSSERVKFDRVFNAYANGRVIVGRSWVGPRNKRWSK